MKVAETFSLLSGLFPDRIDLALGRAAGTDPLTMFALQRGRKLPDLLVAAAAEARGLTVLHYDSDFDQIAAATGQACEWVVPAGSVD